VLVHKFACNNGHVFYIPLGLPRTLRDVGKLFTSVSCPICQKASITFSFKEYELLEDDRDEISSKA
jgi:hypothetical protein